jgi:hypothetical protein
MLKGNSEKSVFFYFEGKKVLQKQANMFRSQNYKRAKKGHPIANRVSCGDRIIYSEQGEGSFSRKIF